MHQKIKSQLVFCLNVFVKCDDNEQLISTYQTGFCGKAAPQNKFMGNAWIASMAFLVIKPILKGSMYFALSKNIKIMFVKQYHNLSE